MIWRIARSEKKNVFTYKKLIVFFFSTIIKILFYFQINNKNEKIKKIKQKNLFFQ